MIAGTILVARLAEVATFMLFFCLADLPLPPLIASVFAVDFYVVGKSPVRSIVLRIAESRRIFGSVQRVTTTDVRIRAVAKNRADIEGFMGQIKLSFRPFFLRDAGSPLGIPSDPVVALSHDPDHINCAILDSFVSKYSDFRARCKALCENDVNTALHSQSDASRGVGSAVAAGGPEARD